MNRESPPSDEYKEKRVNQLTFGCLVLVLLFFASVVGLVLLTAFGVIHPFGIGEVCT